MLTVLGVPAEDPETLGFWVEAYLTAAVRGVRSQEVTSKIARRPTGTPGRTQRCVFLDRDARLALADYLEHERPHNRAELERRLGHANDR